MRSPIPASPPRRHLVQRQERLARGVSEDVGRCETHPPVRKGALRRRRVIEHEDARMPGVARDPRKARPHGVMRPLEGLEEAVIVADQQPGDILGGIVAT